MRLYDKLWIRFFYIICVFSISLPTWTQNLAQSKVLHGKTLLTEYEVDAKTLAQIDERRLMPFLNKEKSMIFNQTISAAQKGNPYRIAVIAHGQALVDGISEASWNVELMSEKGGFGGLGRSAIHKTLPVQTQAGQRVNLLMLTPALSMRQDRELMISVQYNESNFKMDRLIVQVWSGVPSATELELLFSYAPALTGLVFLGLFIWWKRR